MTPRKRPAHAVPALLVAAGERQGHTIRLDAAQFVIGRDPNADLVLTDSGVSRRHAKILRAGDGIYNLVDLESTNGVLVNGVRIEVTVLRDNDRVDIGPTARLVFTYDLGTAPVTEPTEPLPLSERQLEVARLVCEGLSNQAIATRLGISRRTVTSHLDHIYNRLEIGSRAELAHWLTRRGLA